MVDNSQKDWFRPIFHQDGGSCGQASGIGYLFTYEINRIRNLPAHLPQHKHNQYPTHYTWNYLNSGTGTGSWYYCGWDIIKDSGIPNVANYGGLWQFPEESPPCTKRRTVWVNGYEFYSTSLENKVDLEYLSINVSTPEGLQTLKHWLNDHGEGGETGGVANFAAVMPHFPEDYGVIPTESEEAGKKIILAFGHAGYHAMTIVGYNDNIKYDFNGDGEFTNPEGNMAEWEVGALKVANSWGGTWPTQSDSGFVYVPYRLLPPGAGSISPNTVHVLKILEELTPKVTMRVKIQHPRRNKIEILTGVAEDPLATVPDLTQEYRPYRLYTTYPPHINGGGFLPMQGINDEPIEIELDVTSILNGVLPGKFFLEINEYAPEPDSTFNGQILDLTLVDYDTQNGIPLEVNYTGTSFPVPIVKNGTTILPISYDYIPSSITEMVTINREFILNKDVRVGDGGVLKVSNTGRLVIPGSKQIVVKTGSTLILNNCSHLEVFPGGQIIVEEGAILQISPNAILNLHDGRGAFNLSNGAIIPQGFVNPSVDVPPTYRINGGFTSGMVQRTKCTVTWCWNPEPRLP